MHRIKNTVIPLSSRTTLFSLRYPRVGSVKSLLARLYTHGTFTDFIRVTKVYAHKTRETARRIIRCPELHNNDTRFVCTLRHSYSRMTLGYVEAHLTPRGTAPKWPNYNSDTRRGCPACEVPRNLSSLGP